jgi:hypothetical protein
MIEGSKSNPSRRDIHTLSLLMPLHAYAAILGPEHDSHFLYATGLSTCPTQSVFFSDKPSVRI